MEAACGSIRAFLYEFLRVFRHGIESALRKWTAAQQALHRQHKSPARAVERNGFMRIVGARRIKFARTSKERREQRDVEAHSENQQPRARGFCARGHWLRF